MAEARGQETAPALDEPSLLARLRAGEDEAFEELVRLYGGRMLAVARRLLPSEEEARDAVQDAFLNAYRGVGRFQGGARLSTWLHRITVNAALMKLRTRRRRPEEPIEPLLPEFRADGRFLDRLTSWDEPVDRALERDENRRLVRRLIEELPDSYRTVLLLRDIEGLDTREAADALGIPENTVKVRLHRARQALRTRLAPHLGRTGA